MHKENSKLEKAIETEYENVSEMEAGSEEKASAVEDLTKLLRVKSDLEKAEKEHKYKVIQFLLEGSGLILPLVFYAAQIDRGFKFEETGGYSSLTFRNLLNYFKPKKI